MDEISPTQAWHWLLARHRRQPPPFALTRTVSGEWHGPVPLSQEAISLLECLAPLVETTKRLALAQLGQSLDGRIATQSGHSHYINGPQSLVHLHRLRALVDAVVIGVGTASADNPQLSVRHVEGESPVRVILDPRGRAPQRLGILQNGPTATLHLIGDNVSLDTHAAGHVTRQRLALDSQGHFQPQAVLDALAAHGLKRVLIEGGGVTVSRFIQAGVIHHLHLLVAPLLIGSGRPGLTLPPIETLHAALRPPVRCFACGDDTLFDVTLLASG
ncbi:RibD family protein [Halomonas sediminis]